MTLAEHTSLSTETEAKTETEFSGKHVIVSGGGSGVGAAIAQGFSQQGANVTILGRDAQKLSQQNLPYQCCDVTDAGAVRDAVNAARAAQGPVAIAIANAGNAQSVPFVDMSPEIFQDMVSVNLVGVVNLWQATLPDMITAGWGRLIAVASTAGLKGYPYVSAYCAAKHGVIGLTRSVATEMARSGITTNALCPGFTDTPMLERSVETIVDATGLTREMAMAALIKGNPQGRLINPREVAEAALWLSSAAAHSVNGHALPQSGGEI
jgi:NAD(P)-dependent dehydrogenase (short-subunit alcohol dehydrogenase family)